MNPFKETPQFESKPSGYVILDGQEVGHTKQCIHCNKHFLSVKGSGTIRGYFMTCLQFTCGSPACDTCIPYEAKMEVVEGNILTAQHYWKETTFLNTKGQPLI